MVYVKYYAPCFSEADGTELAKWYKNCQTFETNLRILLRLPYHR